MTTEPLPIEQLGAARFIESHSDATAWCDRYTARGWNRARYYSLKREQFVVRSLSRNPDCEIRFRQFGYYLAVAWRYHARTYVDA